jgi:hypothetical protein
MQLTKTRDEVIREAADKLTLAGTAQPLEAEYGEKLDSNLDPLLLQLAEDDICEVVNPGYIPAQWFDAISGLLANICAPLGGKTFDPRIKEYYEMQLKRLTSTGPSYSVMETDYF